jgi:tRNA-specific 2-thiouridylase
MATGHYARIVPSPEGQPLLARGADRRKDQSYFLFAIDRTALPLVRFPLGGLTKDAVRAMARERGLAAAERPESQEICFVPPGEQEAFVRARSPVEALAPGPIVDTSGRRLGEHRGLAGYTVGQRRGLGLAAGSPLYVVALDPAANTLVVGPDAGLWSRELIAAGVNWLAPERGGEFRADVRIRSRHVPAAATVAPVDGGAWRVRFDEPQRAITPGQAAVFYDGDVVLGGGWIDSWPN